MTNKPLINRGGGAVAGVGVIYITAVFIGGNGPVAAEIFSVQR